MALLQQTVDRHSQELLPIFVRIFIFIYVVIGGAHLLLLPEEIVAPMTIMAFASVALGIFVQANLSKPFIADRAETLMLIMLIIMGMNTMSHMYLTDDIRQTTNFIFVMAVSGYVLPGARSFYIALFFLIGSWGVAVSGTPIDSDATHFGFEILLGMMFAVFLHTVRRNQLQQMSDLESTIDRLHQSQDRVLAGESLIQTVLDQIPAGIIVRGADTSVLYSNAEARRVLRIEDESLFRLLLDEIKMIDINGNPLLPDDFPGRRVLARGEPVTNEIMGVIHDDGDILWALVNSFMVDLEGEGERVVLTAFVDVSARIEMENQLRQSETRAHAILESVHEGVISVDAEQVVTLFNPGARQITGVSEAEALGKPLTSVFHYFEDEQSLELPDATPIQQGVIRSRTGEEIAVELLISEIMDESTVNGYVYTFRDVREQQRIEQERTTLDKMSSVGVLAGGIAHDFNNLLTAIYGNVALAENAINDREKALGFLQRSSESIELATNLTKQLLTFATGSEPVRDVVDVEKLVREATRFSLSGSSVAVTFRIDENIDAAEVDGGQVQQAISNIVLNAKQAMGDTGRLTIRVQNSESVDGKRYVSVSIADDGPGIEADLLSKIFDPYFTTKDTGTGLGLASTHSIIVKHGGSISVESPPGEGTTFTLLLPSAGPLPENNGNRETSQSVAEGGLEVLVMDDEEVVLLTIVRLLEHLGHQVTPTRDGAEAIAEYSRKSREDQAYDLVIMDLTVAGGMGGMEAAAEILAHDPDARLVVSSGYSAGAEMARYRELGFCARLEKPFRAAELEAIIDDVITQPPRTLH